MEEPKSAVEYLNEIVDLNSGKITSDTSDSCIAQPSGLDNEQENEATTTADAPANPTAAQGDGMQGGNGDMISFNDLVVLIVLYHGSIDPSITSRITTPPLITSIDFPHIKNAANLSLAPTGMVNVGTGAELINQAKTFLEIFTAKVQEGFRLQIDDIKEKSDRIIEPSLDRRSTPYKICDYCIDFAKKKYEEALVLVSRVSGQYMYTKFEGILRVCRSKLFPMSVGGNGKRGRDALDPPSSKRSAATLNFEISPPLCLVIFDNVRRSIKEEDCRTFQQVCRSVCPPNEYCTQAGLNTNSRCRIINIMKGFGDVNDNLLPFVDKYLIYSSKTDKPLGMGVIKITFSIDANANVTIDQKKYDPENLMTIISYHNEPIPVTPEQPQTQTMYFSTMKRCIEYCTKYDDKGAFLNPTNQTVLVFDLSCSSSGRVLTNPLPLDSNIRFARPGGGYPNNKNKTSSLRKKTKKIQRKRTRTAKLKTRPPSVKYLRNRRYIKKNKNKTKKFKRTRRS